jgi:predicted transcriptional regulator
MPKSVRDVPPPLELLCLKALWTLEKGNVKEVQRIVAETRPLAYTTIMTVLDRLTRKGKLSRQKVGRAFVYSPQASRDAMRRLAIRELLEGFFDGSQAELVRFLENRESHAPLAVAAAAGGSQGAPEDERIDTILL